MNTDYVTLNEESGLATETDFWKKMYIVVVSGA